MEKTSPVSPADRDVITSKHNPLDYIFFLRPALHPPAWTIVILGYFAGPAPVEPLGVLIWLMLLSSGAAGWAYIVNQIADIESDRVNGKLFFLPQGLISLRASYIFAAVIFAVTLAGAFRLGDNFGVLFFIGLLMGYIYSGMPFYGKNRPIIGTLLNGLAYGIMPFIAGFAGAGGGMLEGMVRSIPYFFSVAAVSVGTTFPDMEGDSKTGKITPAVALGARSSIFLMCVLLVLAIAGSVATGDTFLLVSAAASLPFYAYAALRSDANAAVAAAKISILALSLAACYRFWPYAIILLALFVITRIYYRFRFDMVYPRLC